MAHLRVTLVVVKPELGGDGTSEANIGSGLA